MYFFKKRIKSDYEKEFLEALNFSKKELNVKIPFKFSQKKILSDNASLEISNAIFKEYGDINFKEFFSANCATVNCLMFDFLKKFCGHDIYYTIGYLADKVKKNKNGEKLLLFNEDKKKIVEYIKGDLVRIGNPEDFKMNIHVWVTLPSMEIIDLTLSTSLSNIPHFYGKEKPGRIIAGYPWNKNNDFEYHPQVIVPSNKILNLAYTINSINTFFL
jgi:hypothetical protein